LNEKTIHKKVVLFYSLEASIF